MFFLLKSVPFFSEKGVINKLIKKIGIKNIKINSKVVKIEQPEDTKSDYIKVFTDKKIYNCNKLVVATTIESLRKLFTPLKIYKEIEAQPFIRIYGIVSKKFIPIYER